MSLTNTELSKQLELFEFSKGRKASWATLQRMLPDVQTALFFARAFKLDYTKLSALVYGLFNSPLIDALKSGNHSKDLQDYLIDTIPDVVWQTVSSHVEDEAPHGEFLPELWDAIDVVVAQSISDVAEKLAGVLDSLPSKEGKMVFQHLMAVNRQRPVLGDYKARIKHDRLADNLVIFDDSGSMSQTTVEAIAEDVVALSWKANATLALVSNTCRVWEPGTYNVRDILSRAEYGGTQYETLGELLDKDWGTVITIADYDSALSAKQSIATRKGRIGKVLDLSLVNRPTFLAECVGQLADEVEPMLVAASNYQLR